MGTNYYLYRPGTRPRPYDEEDPVMDESLSVLEKILYREPDLQVPCVHLGKSSGGWCFSVRVYPTQGIHTWEDWKDVLESHPDWTIFDEYRKEVSREDFYSTVENRSRPEPVRESFEKNDARFYRSSSLEEHLRRNYAQEGPNNLLRHAIGHGTISHGNGTWDHLDCEFS